MATVTYNDLLNRAYNRGTIASSTDWFSNKINSLYFPRYRRSDSLNPDRNRVEILRNATNRMVSGVTFGAMQLFHYDPKYKDVLPIYDTFPLCIPFKPEPNGFLGLNFHYLPPMMRANLLDKLMMFLTDKKLNDNTRFRMTYELLSNVVQHDLFKPCLKRYLNNHVRSQFIYITPEEWNKVLFLPLENFVRK